MPTRLGIARNMLLMLLALQILLPCSAFASADDFQPFTVTGNASVFKMDEENGGVKLADCRITNVCPGSDIWAIPETYQTADAIQRLFDLIIGGTVYPLTKEDKKEINSSSSGADYEVEKNVDIDFESLELDDTSKGTNSLPDGQGNGFLTLRNYENLPEGYPDNLVSITINFVTNKGKTSYSFCMESQALRDLVEEMLVRK